MTREEAVNKIIRYTGIASDAFLDALEALGLLKFEEDKQQQHNIEIRIGSHIHYVSMFEIDRALKEKGWRVVEL